MTITERKEQILKQVAEHKETPNDVYVKMHENGNVVVFVNIVTRSETDKRFTFISSTHWSSQPVRVSYEKRYGDSDFTVDIDWSSGGTLEATSGEIAEGMSQMIQAAERIVKALEIKIEYDKALEIKS